jgi:hypothetical protein
LEMSTVKKIPAFLGEVDVIKSLQLLPGVSTVGEGASGFNVRGGNVGQNLILLDEAPVYNSSHFFGFFSVFNPDAVKEFKLYKGGVPAQYGGRISSVLDIRMKEGNNKEYHAQGGLGTVFGRFSVEGPLVKDKSSFILAGRRSWIDALLKPTPVLGKDDQLYFYDLTMKANYNINEKNRVYVSGYLGRDIFGFPGAYFSWGNKTGTVRWNHLVSDRLFTNFSMIFSEYEYDLEFGEDQDTFDWNSRIQTIDFKPQASFFINSRNELNFGGELIYYNFEPANASGLSSGQLQDFSVPEKYALESAAYINNEQKVTENLTLSYGLRMSAFSYMGPGEVYDLETVTPGRRKKITNTTIYGSGESIVSYFTPEPRFSFNYRINQTNSIKGGYNRMAQYIHLISVSTASNPLDLWAPSTNNVLPERAHAFSLGYFKNLKNNTYEFSSEVYYRTIQDQLDYRNGLSLNELLINKYVERELLSAQARAYGIELYAKKTKGKVNGWLSYTLSKAELQADGLNRGNWYAANYDQRHSIKMAAFYDLNERITFSANFTYNTGRPYTAMDQVYTIAGYNAYHSSNGDRNSKRIPDYHRLDLAMTINLLPKNLMGRKYESDLVIGVYNAYARKNAFSVYVNPGDSKLGSVSVPQYKQLAILGTILPSLSYNFKF